MINQPMQAMNDATLRYKSMGENACLNTYSCATPLSPMSLIHECIMQPACRLFSYCIWHETVAEIVAGCVMNSCMELIEEGGVAGK